MDYLIRLMRKVSAIFENLSGGAEQIFTVLLYIVSQGRIEHPRPPDISGVGGRNLG